MKGYPNPARPAPPYRWPWNDRGRSKLTREQIEREAVRASFEYARAMGTEAKWPH